MIVANSGDISEVSGVKSLGELRNSGDITLNYIDYLVKIF